MYWNSDAVKINRDAQEYLVNRISGQNWNLNLPELLFTWKSLLPAQPKICDLFCTENSSTYFLGLNGQLHPIIAGYPVHPLLFFPLNFDFLASFHPEQAEKWQKYHFE